MQHDSPTCVPALPAYILPPPGLLVGCTGRTPHQRLKWKAEDFFTDPGVISLCKAIEAKNLKEIDRLVKSGNVNVNAKGRGNMTPLLWRFPRVNLSSRRCLN